MSNYEQGIAPESGTLAGPGSYVGLNADGDFILTTGGSGGGGGSETDPGGSNTQVQFNDGGNFGGDSGFTFNKTSNTVMVTGSLRLTGSDAAILVIEKAPGDSTKEIVFVEEGTEQGGIYFNNNDNFFVRNENNGKDIIIRIENASGTGRNLIRAAGTSEGVIVGFANNKTIANAVLDVDGATTLSGTLTVTGDTTFEGEADFQDDVKLFDDKPLMFGSEGDASIKYDEASSNKLIISGSKDGILLSGQRITVDFANGTIPTGALGGGKSYLGLDSNNNIIVTGSTGGGGSTSPGGSDNQIQFNNGGAFGASANLTFDDTFLASSRAIFGTTAATLTVAAGELSTLSNIDSGSNKYTGQYDAIGKLQGHVITLGASPTVGGQLYYLSGNGTWHAAQADDEDDGGESLLAVAVNTNSSTHGMLRRGTIRITGSLVSLPDEIEIGMPVYVSKYSAGQYQFAPPTGSGEFVRRVGYCIDKNGSVGSPLDFLLLFEPSDTFVEIA